VDRRCHRVQEPTRRHVGSRAPGHRPPRGPGPRGAAREPLVVRVRPRAVRPRPPRLLRVTQGSRASGRQRRHFLIRARRHMGRTAPYGRATNLGGYAHASHAGLCVQSPHLPRVGVLRALRALRALRVLRVSCLGVSLREGAQLGWSCALGRDRPRWSQHFRPPTPCRSQFLQRPSRLAAAGSTRSSGRLLAVYEACFLA
jgi:hypothetical protein